MKFFRFTTPPPSEAKWGLALFQVAERERSAVLLLGLAIVVFVAVWSGQ